LLLDVFRKIEFEKTGFDGLTLQYALRLLTCGVELENSIEFCRILDSDFQRFVSSETFNGFDFMQLVSGNF